MHFSFEMHIFNKPANFRHRNAPVARKWSQSEFASGIARYYTRGARLLFVSYEFLVTWD